MASLVLYIGQEYVTTGCALGKLDLLRAHVCQTCAPACGAGVTKYHRAKRQGRAWLRGHFPYNEFTISRCAAGAHRACARRGTMLRRNRSDVCAGPTNVYA